MPVGVDSGGRLISSSRASSSATSVTSTAARLSANWLFVRAPITRDVTPGLLSVYASATRVVGMPRCSAMSTRTSTIHDTGKVYDRDLPALAAALDDVRSALNRRPVWRRQHPS